MFLLLIASRAILKKVKVKDLFQPLFDEIDFINRQNLEIEVLSKKYYLKIEIGTVNGDNKAIHELLNITLSFKSKSCRSCKITYKRLNDKNQPVLTEFSERNLEKDQVFDGKLFSCFNFCHDIFHDIAYGACDKVFIPTMRIYYSQNDKKDLLERLKLTKFRYGKIEDISSSSIKGNGMQKLEFFIFLPFLDDLAGFVVRNLWF